MKFARDLIIIMLLMYIACCAYNIDTDIKSKNKINKESTLDRIDRLKGE
jgi:hypothetical protein